MGGLHPASYCAWRVTLISYIPILFADTAHVSSRSSFDDSTLLLCSFLTISRIIPLDWIHQLVGKNMSIVVGNSAYHRESAEPFLTQTPLVLLLLASAVVSLYTAVLTFRLYIDVVAKNPLYLLQMVGISWPCK